MNAATRFAIRTLLRRATEKACPVRKGSNAGGPRAQYWSAAALARSEKLEVDHLVPLSQLIEHVTNVETAQDAKQIRALVDQHALTACVTADEHRRLLKAKMPTDWDGHDKFARHKHAGIQLFDENGEPAW